MIRRLAITAAVLWASAAAAIQPGSTGSITLRNGAVDVNEADNFAWTGSHDYGTALLEAPNGTTVTSGDCDAAGEAGRVFVDTDGAGGAIFYVCLGVAGWIPIDSAFGASIDGTELAATVTLPVGTVLDAATNDADIRLAETTSNGTNAGSCWIDGTSGKLECYSSVTTAGVREYATANYLSTFTANQTFNDSVRTQWGTSSTASYSIGYASSVLTLRANTSDGSDNVALSLAGGGGGALLSGETRGAFVYANGNEVASVGGDLYLVAGNISGGDIVFWTQGSVLSTPRGAFEYDGDFCVGLLACTRSIGLSGEAARTIGLETEATAADAGRNLTINAGGSGSNSNLSGGDLILASGAGTGDGESKIVLQTVTASQGSGTTARAVTTKFQIDEGHHIEQNSSVLTPTMGTCGTSPSVVTGSTDTAGRITIGTSMSAGGDCTVNFAKTWTNAPFCVFSLNSDPAFATGSASAVAADAALWITTTTSAFTLNVTGGTLADSSTFSYVCIGYEAL